MLALLRDGWTGDTFSPSVARTRKSPSDTDESGLFAQKSRRRPLKSDSQHSSRFGKNEIRSVKKKVEFVPTFEPTIRSSTHAADFARVVRGKNYLVEIMGAERMYGGL